MRTLAIAILLAGAAFAGGGPETTLLVVNGASPLSRRVANEYAAMRDIPAANVIELTDVPASLLISYTQFKSRIWTPVATFLDREGQNIDCIVYSTGFPTAIDLGSLLEGSKLEDTTTPVGSLTGLTYLARRVEVDDPMLVDLHVNKYYRIDFSQHVLTSVPMTDADQKRFAAAMGAMMAQKPEAARDAYAAFLEHYPSHPMSWFNYAVCLAQTGDGDGAIVALSKGIDVGWNDTKKTEEDPSLAPLLNRPRMRKLLDKMHDRKGKVQDGHGFRSRYRWVGRVVPTLKDARDSPDRYYLSAMLGFTGPRGNSVPEILAALKRSVEADGTEPEGTVYLAANHDVRARTRVRGHKPASKALKALGVATEVVAHPNTLPKQKNDVLGVVAGVDRFDWGKSGSTLLPGAICETLSSFGAAFEDKRDTKLSEWIRAGAAGTSGTVAEAFPIWQKFPHPSMHVHYAEGCSFAESIFQSIAGPYQTLVVGDALARPFAVFATIEPNVPEGPWKGSVTFTPAIDPGADPVSRFPEHDVVHQRHGVRRQPGKPPPRFFGRLQLLRRRLHDARDRRPVGERFYLRDQGECANRLTRATLVRAVTLSVGRVAMPS